MGEKVPIRKSPPSKLKNKLRKPRNVTKTPAVKAAVSALQKSAAKRRTSSRKSQERQKKYAPSLRDQALEMRNLPNKLKNLTDIQVRTNAARNLDAFRSKVASTVVGKVIADETPGVRFQDTPIAQAVLGVAFNRNLILGATFAGEGRRNEPSLPKPDSQGAAPKLKVLPTAVIPIKGLQNRLAIAYDPESRTIITKGAFSSKLGMFQFEFRPQSLSLSVFGNIKLQSGKVLLGGNLNPGLPSAHLGYQAFGISVTGSVGFDAVNRAATVGVNILFDVLAFARKFKKSKSALSPKLIEDVKVARAKADKLHKEKQKERRRAEAEKRKADDKRRLASN